MNQNKRRIVLDGAKEKWENTTKEQPSLFSLSGKKRRESLQEETEAGREKNEKLMDYSKKLLEKMERDRQERIRRDNRRFIKEQAKSALFSDAKEEAKHMASLTETKTDDKRAARMRLSDLESIIYDDSVGAEDFVPEVLSKYM